MHNLSLVMVPGRGLQRLQVDPNATLADLVQEYGLTNRSIFADGRAVSPDMYDSIRLGTVGEVFATKSVKGN